jgi:hypothetical protein
MPEWVAYCHMCIRAHAEWMTGDTWQCCLCLFRIPAAHVWWWCETRQERAEPTQMCRTDANAQMYVQAEMSL